jgi:hypothetical protein
MTTLPPQLHTGNCTRRIPILQSTLILPRTCRHPFTRVGAGGESVRYICGRWRCSVECRKRWSRRMCRRLSDELRSRPARFHVRLTCHSRISDRELSRGHSRFWSRLRRATKCEYFAVNEWSSGRRHVHAVVRSVTVFSSAVVGRLWSLSLPGHVLSHHSGPIRSQDRLAAYILKLAESPPATFAGRLFSTSRGFFHEAATCI